MKRNKKGFTLAELLVVVAIIAVLVAIAIPVFNGATEKAKQATDDANLRAAKAEVAAYTLLGEFEGDKTVTLAPDKLYYDYENATWVATPTDAMKGKSSGNSTKVIKADLDKGTAEWVVYSAGGAGGGA